MKSGLAQITHLFVLTPLLILQVAPTGGPLKALIFDSYYDTYRGVVVYFRVMDGELRPKDKIKFMASGKEYEVVEVGFMTPEKVSVDCLRAGEVSVSSGRIPAGFLG